MGERTGYEPGTFCWTDLGTMDAAGAKAFYTQLFGWDAQDVPAGNGRTYTLARLGGNQVAGLFEDEQRPHPSWLSYVSVDDVDATASSALELGAETMQEPFDVMTIGRMAVLRDPTGAVFAIWQAGDSFGAELVNDPGHWSTTSSTRRTWRPRRPFTRSSSAGGSSPPGLRNSPTGGSTSATG